jgi:hypothetical protein
MGSLQILGAYSLTNRKLFYSEIEEYSSHIDLSTIKSTYFNCFLYWNDSNVKESDLNFVKQLIDAGCIYFDIWGPDCEKQHDIIDELICLIYPYFNSDDIILTSWHSSDSLDAALWTFLNANYPANKYCDECRSSFALSIKGTEINRHRIKYSLMYPDKFSRNVLND